MERGRGVCRPARHRREPKGKAAVAGEDKKKCHDAFFAVMRFAAGVVGAAERAGWLGAIWDAGPVRQSRRTDAEPLVTQIWTGRRAWCRLGTARGSASRTSAASGWLHRVHQHA